MANFTISKWHEATTREHVLVNTPCITLSQVDEVYQQKGLCRTIVGMNFSALFQMGGAKGNFNDTLFYAAVDRFIAKHGTQCTMYDLILYCDAYRDTYKDRFTSNEDISDYSKQFPLYLKHKAMVSDANKPKEEQPQQKKGEKKLVGKEALEDYLIKAAKQGDNLLEGGLVAVGIVSREHASEVIKAAQLKKMHDSIPQIQKILDSRSKTNYQNITAIDRTSLAKFAKTLPRHIKDMTNVDISKAIVGTHQANLAVILM